MNALEIFYARRKLGTMSRDYGKTIDDVLHVEDAKELDAIEDALLRLEAAEKELAEIKGRAEERRIVAQNVVDAFDARSQFAKQPQAEVRLIDFIIKGEGK